MQVQVLANKITTFFIQKPLLYVLLLWVSVIAITSPHLNRPLSKHYEYNPSIVLICIENWQTIGGPKNANFTPLINYQNATDKLPGYSTDKQHQFVNASFGNLWYLMPYYYHTFLGIKATVFSLQIYNLLLLFISLILVTQISTAVSSSINNNLPQLLIPLFYAISPVVTWFCTNGYVHEVAVLPFYLSALLLLYNLFYKNSISFPKLILLSILIFLGTLNDWLFAPLCAITSLYAIYLFIKTKKVIWLSIIAACTIGFITAIITILYCYSKQMGLQQLIGLYINRWGERGLTSNVSITTTIKLLGRNYIMSFAGLVLIGFAICIKKVRYKVLHLLKNKTVAFFLFLSLSVGLMHQLIFVQFSCVHDYSVLKMALPLSIFASIILTTFTLKIRRIITICVIFSFLSSYYFVNRLGQFAQNGDKYDYLQTLGSQISNIVSNNEILVFNDSLAVPQEVPQLIYYTKRNYICVSDETSCKAYMVKYGFKKACFITLNNWQIQSAKHIQL